MRALQTKIFNIFFILHKENLHTPCERQNLSTSSTNFQNPGVEEKGAENPAVDRNFAAFHTFTALYYYY